MKILIVEDEPLCAQSLQADLCYLLSDADIIGITGKLSQAASLILAHQPDLVFLDVHLQDGQGIQLFQCLPADYTPTFELIFTTAYDKYAITAFKMGALHYLLKPIDTEELQDALLRIRNHFTGIQKEQTQLLLEQQNPLTHLPDKIAIISHKNTELIRLNDIVYAEADSNYTNFYLHRNKVIASKPLKHYEDFLPNQQFIRIHEKHLVNRAFIQQYIPNGRGGDLILKNGEVLKVATRRKDDLLSFLKQP